MDNLLMKMKVDTNKTMRLYESENYDMNLPDEVIFTGDGSFSGEQIGNGLKFEGGVLCVDTTDVAEADNTKPITSAGVYTQIGNIEVLLSSL